MAKRYTAAFIGLGGFSAFHAKAYSLLPNVKVIAGCDMLPEKHAAWSNRVRQDLPVDAMRFYTDAAEMLDTERPDLVTITTRHDQHHPLTLLCAKHGVKGILCEKPIAMDLQQADEMIAACRKSGTKLSIGHQRRFNQEWIATRKLLDRGTIGKVIQAVSRWPGGDAQWYRYAILGGGTLMWLSVHSIDLLRWTLGGVAAVTGQIDMGCDASDCESRAYAVLEFKGGPRGIVDSGTGIGPEASLGHSIVFYGEKGTIQCSDGHGVRYKTTGRPRWREVSLDRETLPWQVGAVHALAAEWKDTMRAIEKDTDTLVSGREARADLEVVLGIYESERTGGRVKLPLKRKTSPLADMNKAGGFGAVTWKP